MGYVLVTAAAVLLLLTVVHVQQQRQRDAIGRQRGCEPLVQHQPVEPFLGLDFQLTIHNDISSLHRFHQQDGNTFQVKALVAMPTILTVSPENIKRINTRDHEWGVQPDRLPGMESFCGRGFITTDGDTWRHARRLLRPSFDKNNLVDLSVLSRETDQLLEQLPVEGTTVDLQPLLHVMVGHNAGP